MVHPSARHSQFLLHAVGLLVLAFASRLPAATQAATAPFEIAPHTLITETHYADRSDEHAELVWERSWQLHPSERRIELTANVVTFENPATGDGFVWLRLAPTAVVRTWDKEPALLIERRGDRWLATPGRTALPYAVHRMPFRGGTAGRTQALHAWQRAQQPARAGRDGLLLSNTWGDRSRADKLSEDFIRAEIERAAALGVEVVQIDDGWQRGRTANTVAKGGVWNGFWAADPNYWTPDPQRFPRGLAPLAAHAKDRGLRLGLWYAPDSANECTNWERDAAQVLSLWRELGVAHIKLDAVKLLTPRCEERFRAFLDRLQAESRGEILADLDTTAEARLGFWGRPAGAAIFVENRYTDRPNYYPHSTLRMLWSLAATVLPSRLRVEFLNPARNDAKYGADPLRPAAYPPETLFAITMLGSPLAWFENTGLSDDFVARVAPLVALWKQHRAELHGGAVLPLGARPDGHAWTGFLIVDATGAPRHLLVFRESSPDPEHALAWPRGVPAVQSWTRIAGQGEAAAQAGTLKLHVPAPRQFLWLKAGN
jgi:alpha-galactosidase